MPPQAPSLPTGWDSDYDGTSQKWFYIYRPTGQTQLQFPKPGDHLIQTIIDEQMETPLVKEFESASISPSQEPGPVIDSISDIKQPAPKNPAQQPIRRLSELTRKPIPQSSSPRSESTQSSQNLTSTSVPTAPQISSPVQTQQKYQPSQDLLTSVQIQSSPLLQNTSPTINLNHSGSPHASQSPQQPLSPASNNGTQGDTDRHRMHASSTSAAAGLSNATQATQPSLPQSGVQRPAQGVQFVQKPHEHQTFNMYQTAQSTASSNSPIAQPNSIASTPTLSLHSSHGCPPILPSSPAPSYSIQQDSCQHSPSFQHSQNTIQVSSASPGGATSHSPTQARISSQLHDQHGFQNITSHSQAQHSTTPSGPSHGPSHSYTTSSPPTASPSSNNPQRFGMPPGHPLIHAGIYIVYPRLPSQSQQTYTYQPLNQPQPPAAPPKPQNSVQGQYNQHIHPTVNVRPLRLSTHPQPSQIQHNNGATHFQPQISAQQTVATAMLFQKPQNVQQQQHPASSSQPSQSPGVAYIQNSNGTITLASLTTTSPSGQVPQITYGNHSIQQQHANVSNTHAQQVQNQVYVGNPGNQGSVIDTTQQHQQHQQPQQQQSQANIFSAPASLAAKANRGDVPAKFAVGAANTANKAVSGAKNLLKGTAGKKVAVAVSGAVVGEALGMSGAQGARLANAIHNQYQNAAQQNGQPAVSQGSVVAISGGNPLRPGTIQGVNLPNTVVQGYTRPNGTVLTTVNITARPNSTYQPNFQGVGTGLPAGRLNALANAQVQASGRRPVGQHTQGNLAHTPTNNTILQLGESIQHIIQQSSTHERPQHPHTHNQQQPSQSQYDQSYQTNDPPGYEQAQQYTDSASDFQGSPSDQFETNLVSSQWDSASSGTEQPSYSQSITPQPLFYTLSSQSSEQLQQATNDQSSSVTYANDSPDFASAQQAYSNGQLSDQIPEQSFGDYSTVTATNDNYAFTDYSSAQINTQEISYAQDETQTSLATDTYCVDDGSNINVDYSTNIEDEADADMSMSQCDYQGLDGSSIDGTTDSYNVNEDYSVDGEC